MAWSPYADGDGLVDLFGGQTDLAARIIRCVGQPEQRFREDARAFCVPIVLPPSLALILIPPRGMAPASARGLLSRISVERICAELKRILFGEQAAEALRMMAEDGVLDQICPEFDRTGIPVLPKLPDELAPRLAALFWRLPTARAASALSALRFPGAVIRRVSAALALRDLPLEADAALSARQLLRAGGQTAANDLLALYAAFGEDVSAYTLALARVLARGDCTDLGHLAVAGSDLAAIGVPRGPAIGRILGQLLDAVIENPALNEKTRLMILGSGAEARMRDLGTWFPPPRKVNFQKVFCGDRGVGKGRAFFKRLSLSPQNTIFLPLFLSPSSRQRGSVQRAYLARYC